MPVHAFYTENALQTDDAAGPGPRFNRIPVPAIRDNAFPEGSTGSKMSPMAKNAVAIEHK